MNQLKKDNQILVIGVAYPSIKFFLSAYLDSLESQSFKFFTVLIGDDGFDNLDFLLEGRDLDWHTIDVSGSPSENRMAVINKALDLGFQKIIFTDCDDVLNFNRVEVVSKILDKVSIVVNDLDVIDEFGCLKHSGYLSNRLVDGEMISLDHIRAGNLMGLTNTAVRADCLRGFTQIDVKDVIAFDWFLWCSLLACGARAAFTSRTSTKYRVYEGNVAGLPQLITEKNVEKCIKLKYHHYYLMCKIESSFDELMSEFQMVKSKIKNKIWRQTYVRVLQDNAIEKNIWWENFRPPSELEIK
ncbi:hypothetical protein N8Z80_02980 [Litorivicinus sp.]|nr:hypothetical protein [Litorivicinus sp.]MDC1239982.1 hypothetical protein [Litorivicinus sp.]